MDAVTTILKVLNRLDDGPLSKSMVVVPSRGATDVEIAEESRMLKRAFSYQHVAVLKKWNGINLDMIRVFGIGSTEPRIINLRRQQYDIATDVPGCVVFADNPAGFLYAETSDGKVHSVDTQSLDSASELLKQIATDVNDFFSRFVFGEDADKFCGAEWKAQLKQIGLIG